MKCSRCNGVGSVPYHIADDLFDETNCPLCGGSGEVITEQEYIQTCNTEQLADLMSRMLGCSNCPIPKDGRSCMGTYSGCWHEIIKWLKQPHTPKE